MTKNGWWRALLVSAIGALLGTLPGSAHAAGFQLIEQNASGLGNAYAGQAAAAEDAVARWRRQLRPPLSGVSPQVLTAADGSIDEAAVVRIMAGRDNRPIEIQE